MIYTEDRNQFVKEGMTRRLVWSGRWDCRRVGNLDVVKANIYHQRLGIFFHNKKALDSYAGGNVVDVKRAYYPEGKIHERIQFQIQLMDEAKGVPWEGDMLYGYGEYLPYGPRGQKLHLICRDWKFISEDPHD